MANKKKTWDEEIAELFEDYKSPLAYYEPSPRIFRFWDINQKFLSLMNGTLVASPKDSNSTEHLIAVLPNNALGVKQQAIFMGLQNKNHMLSCVKSQEGQNQVTLVNEDIMKVYKQNDKFLNFSFYSRSEGRPETCSFESAEFPGWFISTSSEPNKPIGLSQKGGPENVLFYFERK